MNEAPFCCSRALFFQDQVNLRVQKKKKNAPSRRGGGGGGDDEDEEDDDNHFLFFDDGYNVDLGMYRDLRVRMCMCVMMCLSPPLTLVPYTGCRRGQA